MDPREIFGGPDLLRPDRATGRARLVLPPWSRWSLTALLGALCCQQVAALVGYLMPGDGAVWLWRSVAPYLLVPAYAVGCVVGIGATVREGAYALLWTFPSGYLFCLHVYRAATAAS